jgi:hypothetical protein
VISAQLFSKRLARLCLSGATTGLPRSSQDRHILLKSMQLSFKRTTNYSEADVNHLLDRWLSDVAPSLESDHASLRRALVDYGYLERSADGRTYRVGDAGDFDPAVAELDPAHILREAREAELARKRAHVGEAGA